MPTQDSRDAFAYIDQGDALQKQGRFEQAIESYDAAIALQPANDTAHLNRGVALRASGKVEAAIDSYDRAIAAQPDNPLAHLNRGNALAQLGRRTEADQSYGAAAALRPDDPEIWLNRSNNLMRMGRYEAGIASYDRLIALDPGQADLHANRAAAFRALGNVAEADAGFKRAIAIDPDHFAARFGLAFDTLLLGDLEAGFRQMAAFRYDANLYDRQHPEKSLRRIGDLAQVAGKRLLLHGHVQIFHGLGDTIQFSRYAVLLARMGAEVTLGVDPLLVSLFVTLPANLRIVDNTTRIDPSAFDYHCTIMNLPAVFGTTIDTVPADFPYLSARPDRLETWRHRIGADDFRIAICWQGSTRPDDLGRSFLLRLFEGLSAVPGVRLISVHKGEGASQLESLPDGMRVQDATAQFDSGRDGLLDAAAVIALCDLVITSDTAIAHLAGALGAPAWLALKRTPDWRWMMERPDSPWYPSLRLYRQPVDGDWDSVFAAMERDLRAMLA